MLVAEHPPFCSTLKHWINWNKISFFNIHVSPRLNCNNSGDPPPGQHLIFSFMTKYLRNMTFPSANTSNTYSMVTPPHRAASINASADNEIYCNITMRICYSVLILITYSKNQQIFTHICIILKNPAQVGLKPKYTKECGLRKNKTINYNLIN